jgi:hypothetical protein
MQTIDNAPPSCRWTHSTRQAQRTLRRHRKTSHLIQRDRHRHPGGSGQDPCAQIHTPGVDPDASQRGQDDRHLRLGEQGYSRDLLIAPKMVSAMQALGEVIAAKLVPAVTRQGVTLLIPAKLPTEGTSMTVSMRPCMPPSNTPRRDGSESAPIWLFGAYRIYEAMGGLGRARERPTFSGSSTAASDR